MTCVPSNKCVFVVHALFASPRSVVYSNFCASMRSQKRDHLHQVNNIAVLHALPQIRHACWNTVAIQRMTVPLPEHPCCGRRCIAALIIREHDKPPRPRHRQATAVPRFHMAPAASSCVNLARDHALHANPTPPFLRQIYDRGSMLHARQYRS
jgi:hypothetical protein